MDLNIKIVLMNEDMVPPEYSNKGDAGFDLRSNENVTVFPGTYQLVKIGIKIKIPSGFYGSIRDRSGLAYKNGIHVLGGVVDSGYRGEVGVILTNFGRKNFVVNKGDRIAQMIIQPYATAKFEISDSFDDSERGEGGFGSTGTK